MATFLDAVLSKRYQSPSADIIELLAGLDNVDVVFQGLVGALEQAINYGRTSEIFMDSIMIDMFTDISKLRYETRRSEWS